MFDLYKRELIYATKQKKLKKLTLPSVFTSALGKASTSMMLGKVFAECQVKNTRQSLHLCREPDPIHTAKLEPLPSALDLALGKAGGFAECPPFGIRQSWHIPLGAGHSALFCRVHLGTRQSFAECPRKCTRQSWLCRQIVCRVSVAECYARQTLHAECIRSFAECP